MSDGGLRQIFQKHLPKIHWQSIETLIGRGTPDMNGCLSGQEFWIENKLTSGWAVNFEIGQVAWHERRLRAGGRTFVAVRRLANSGPRKGAACDELWLYRGQCIRQLEAEGLKETRLLATGLWVGGPARWHWDTIGNILLHH